MIPRRCCDVPYQPVSHLLPSWGFRRGHFTRPLFDMSRSKLSSPVSVNSLGALVVEAASSCVLDWV